LLFPTILKFANLSISHLMRVYIGKLYFFSNAKAAIDHIIANEGNGPQRGPPGMGGGHGGGGGGGGGGGFFEMIVAGHKVGLIIGKGGETIKHLQVL
jgi:hypothetical protein